MHSRRSQHHPLPPVCSNSTITITTLNAHRRTVDYCGTFLKLFQARLEARGARDAAAMQPTMAAALDVSEGREGRWLRGFAGGVRKLRLWWQRLLTKHHIHTKLSNNQQQKNFKQILPPEGYPFTPASSLATKFVHNSQNRVRCSVNAVAWQPDGRRCISGAQTGEITLWRGSDFAFESVLQVRGAWMCVLVMRLCACVDALW